MTIAPRDAWRAAFDAAPVHMQWDTERSITGDALGRAKALAPPERLYEVPDEIARRWS